MENDHEEFLTFFSLFPCWVKENALQQQLKKKVNYFYNSFFLLEKKKEIGW